MAQENSNSKKTSLNNLIWYSVGIFDYLNTTAIYISYLTPVMKEVLFRTLQYIFFPIYAANTIIYAVLGLTNLLFDRDRDNGKLKTENIIRLVVNTLSAVLVTTAVIGTLAFAGVMGVASTFLFAANIVVSTTYNFSGAGYHFYQYFKKGRMLKNPELSEQEREILTHERTMHSQKGMGYLVIGATIAIIALGGALAVLGGFLPLAGIGVAAALIGVGFCIYAIARKFHDDKQKKQLVQVDDEPQSRLSPGDTSNIFQKLWKGVGNGNTNSARLDGARIDLQARCSEEKRPLLLYSEREVSAFAVREQVVLSTDSLHSPSMAHK